MLWKGVVDPPATPGHSPGLPVATAIRASNYRSKCAGNVRQSSDKRTAVGRTPQQNYQELAPPRTRVGSASAFRGGRDWGARQANLGHPLPHCGPRTVVDPAAPPGRTHSHSRPAGGRHIRRYLLRERRATDTAGRTAVTTAGPAAVGRPRRGPMMVAVIVTVTVAGSQRVVRSGAPCIPGRFSEHSRRESWRYTGR